jgi:hypothetical protein
MGNVAAEKKIWTAEEIKAKLQSDDYWLERAVLAIYDKQTSNEKTSEQTIEDNGVGFNGPDSRYLSYVARWIKSGKQLDGHHLLKVRSRMSKYSKQLARIANKEI